MKLEDLGLSRKEIDPICIPFIEFFNDPRVGLPTEFSCQGHEDKQCFNHFFILFNAKVTEEDILNFLKRFDWTKLDGEMLNGAFKLWLRQGTDEEWHKNWMYEICEGTVEENQEMAKSDLELFYAIFGSFDS